MHEKINILLVEDNKKLLEVTSNSFRKKGFKVVTTSEVETTIQILQKEQIHIMLLDLMLNGESSQKHISEFLNIDPLLQIIIMTGYATIESAVEAMKNGAYDYIQKPADINNLLKTINNAARYRALKEENSQLKQSLLKSSLFLDFKSPGMKKAIRDACKLGMTELPVLINGESGTGKEGIANIIHSNSVRAGKKLIVVNSSGFSENLIESELFGFEKHSFTGAEKDHTGLFEQANQSSLFLDEIGDMAVTTQTKILRTLQNQEIRKIGSTENINIDVRFIAATNKDIKQLITEGKFREDLYYRINTAIIDIPPLRECPDDVPPLINHFLNLASPAADTRRKCSNEVIELLCGYSWPGNIRELKNVIQYANAMEESETIKKHSLPGYLHNFKSYEKPIKVKYNSTEKDKILKTLEDNFYNKKKTAENLGISRKTLYQKMKSYEIEY